VLPGGRCSELLQHACTLFSQVLLQACLALRDVDLTEPAQRKMCAQEVQQHIPFRRGHAAFDLHDVKGKVVSFSALMSNAYIPIH
jgi:hypothetical protein